MARGLRPISSLVFVRSLLVTSAVLLLLLTTSTASSPLGGSFQGERENVSSRSISTSKWSDIDQDTSSTTMLLEKRGGKGVDRHLIAGATAATFATLTALMTITGNTIKAQDQNKYGVSRKDAASSSSSSSSSSREVKSQKAEKRKIEANVDSANTIKQQQPSSKTNSPHQNTTVINNNFFYLHHGPKEINFHARQIPPGEEDLEQTHLVRRAGLKGRLRSLDPYQKVFEKVEDYGKIGASLGAVTAASIATYSALQAHRAYVLKASKDSAGQGLQDNSTKMRQINTTEGERATAT